MKWELMIKKQSNQMIYRLESLLDTISG